MKKKDKPVAVLVPESHQKEYLKVTDVYQANRDEKVVPESKSRARCSCYRHHDGYCDCNDGLSVEDKKSQEEVTYNEFEREWYNAPNNQRRKYILSKFKIIRRN